MIELVFVICLKTSPGICEDRRDILPPEIGLMQCMMGAQPHLAAWVAKHPEYELVRWSCSDRGPGFNLDEMRPGAELSG